MLSLTVASLLARALLMLGEDQAAEAYIDVCKLGLDTSLLEPAVKWRSLRALLLAQRGQHGSAEQLAREAVAYAMRTDQPATRADAFADLSEVLERAEHWQGAADAAKQALTLYRRKGNRVMELRMVQAVTRLVKGLQGSS
jgi:hypothetical protein